MAALTKVDVPDVAHSDFALAYSPKTLRREACYSKAQQYQARAHEELSGPLVEDSHDRP